MNPKLTLDDDAIGLERYAVLIVVVLIVALVGLVLGPGVAQLAAPLQALPAA